MSDAPATPSSAIDPARLAVALDVLQEIAHVDQSHPDFIAVRRATAHMFKAAKKVRRREIREAIAQADREVVAATATGAADRIDAEPRGIPIRTATTATPASAIVPSLLAVALGVLQEIAHVDQSHPEFIAVRRATAHMFKAAKKVRRREIREAIAQADREVVAATATGAADRIDDETRGIPISTATTAPTAGTLIKARACYICKQPYTLVDAFYHQLCPDCAAMSHAKRTARADLTGQRPLLPGGRGKNAQYLPPRA